MSASTPSPQKPRRVDFSAIPRTPLTPIRRFAPTPIRKTVETSLKDREAGAVKLENGGEQRVRAGRWTNDNGGDELSFILGKLELSEPLIATSPVVLSSDKPVKPEIGVPSGLEKDGSDVVYPLVLPSSGRSSSVLFLPSSTPFPTFPTCPYVKVGPGAIEGADSSDDEAMQSRRTPATRRKKIIRDPDSESESELSVPTSSHRASVTLCDSDSEGDDDVEEEETVYDIAKHYDESYGSLRDFIVDDDDDEYDTGGIDSGTSGEDDGDCHPRRQDPPVRRPALASSGLETLSLDDSPPPKPSLNKAKSGTKQSRREWEAEREQIGADIFTDLDQRVFGGRLRGSKIEWGNRLLTTAGTATSIKIRQADGSRLEEGKITLSEKVLMSKEQIVNTVAHEMCHLACWLISNERKNPHGKVFKTWGRKVMRVRRDIEVTTKHTYEIEYKFRWRCTKETCGRIHKRHSKSIDPERDTCERCGSRLEPLFATKAGTAFQAYLKANMSSAKAALRGATHGEVMRALSRQWTEAGPSADHQAHWESLASTA